MNFNKFELSAIPEIRKYLQYSKVKTCDYTVGGIYMWRDYFKMQYAVRDGTLFSRLYDLSGKEFYNLPLSSDIKSALIFLVNSQKKGEDGMRFCTIPKQYLSLFEENFTIKKIEAQPQYFDYLYSTAELASLEGKKFRNQRNLISQFERSSDNWEMKEISKEELPAVRKFYVENCMVNYGEPTAIEEQNMVLEVLDNFDEYAMTGGLLYSDSTIVGFSLGEIQNDTFFVHIEKADRRIKGAYQMLAHQMVINFALGKANFINREEDMGDSGLKKAKEAYNPIQMLEKFAVEVY